MADPTNRNTNQTPPAAATSRVGDSSKASSVKTERPKLIKLRVRCVPGLSSRGRAGFRFSQTPEEVECTPEQAKLIQEDQMLSAVTSSGSDADFGDNAEMIMLRDENAQLRQQNSDLITRNKALEAQVENLTNRV